VAHPRLVDIDAPTRIFADARGDRQTLEHVISHEALIDAAQSIGEPFEYGFQSVDHLRKLVQ
jgi:hypothetical protein